MVGFIAIGLIVLVFILNLFVRKWSRLKFMPIVYLVCTVIIIIDVVIGTTPRYISLFFIILGVYGIVKSFRDSRTPDRQAIDQSNS
jgi:peptidoglycan/LPS O-acetylase OafA/YrhL